MILSATNFHRLALRQAFEHSVMLQNKSQQRAHRVQAERARRTARDAARHAAARAVTVAARVESAASVVALQAWQATQPSSRPLFVLPSTVAEAESLSLGVAARAQQAAATNATRTAWLPVASHRDTSSAAVPPVAASVGGRSSTGPQVSVSVSVYAAYYRCMLVSASPRCVVVLCRCCTCLQDRGHCSPLLSAGPPHTVATVQPHLSDDSDVGGQSRSFVQVDIHPCDDTAVSVAV